MDSDIGTAGWEYQTHPGLGPVPVGRYLNRPRVPRGYPILLGYEGRSTL